ncbi:cytochrome c biogenesis protein CcdA [Pseudoalteromonas sp. T1lg65]|uniref:cytochrome c biogenesis protein CcdA n=1 Tax=Pseudoalteromonas sp. T1lg65 TaxID=2077101 RepID=UPI003F79BD48
MFGELETFFLTQLTQADTHWWILFIAFTCGLLTSLSPCVYPLIPITLASLRPQENKTKGVKRRAVFYCLGFALLYALLGWLAATTGTLFGQIASHPAIQIGFANLLLYFAGVLKGWLPLPVFPLLTINHQQNAFLLGAASGLVAAPCTSPVLAGLLVYVAANQDQVMGSALLFCFALGMSALLFILGVSNQLVNRLPKSGVWLNFAPNLFTILLIIMAQYYLLKAGQGLYF